MTRSPLWCRTSFIQSSALVQVSSSLSMVRTRNVATGLISSRSLCSPFFRASFPTKCNCFEERNLWRVSAAWWSLLRGQTLWSLNLQIIVLAVSLSRILLKTIPQRWTKLKISVLRDLATRLCEARCLKRAVREPFGLPQPSGQISPRCRSPFSSQPPMLWYSLRGSCCNVYGVELCKSLTLQKTQQHKESR